MKTYNIDQVNSRINSNQQIKYKNNNKECFKKVLDNAGNDIKFSKHAVERINNRNIFINKKDVVRINKGIQKAREKGITQALILMDNRAFIASVKSNTIITTINSDKLKDNVFTNIDGAVVI